MGINDTSVSRYTLFALALATAGSASLSTFIGTEILKASHDGYNSGPASITSVIGGTIWGAILSFFLAVFSKHYPLSLEFLESNNPHEHLYSNFFRKTSFFAACLFGSSLLSSMIGFGFTKSNGLAIDFDKQMAATATGSTLLFVAPIACIISLIFCGVKINERLKNRKNKNPTRSCDFTELMAGSSAASRYGATT